MIYCYVCGVDDLELYRQNEKGVKGVFACPEHNIGKVDEMVLEIVDIIKEGASE